MKRLMPSSLISFLRANPNCLKSDLFVLTLPTGRVIYACEGQQDITVPAGTGGWSGATTTFSAVGSGRWNRGAITSEASFNLNSGTMALTCIPQQGTLYPNTEIPILSAALQGLFDAANISVLTAYMPLGQYGNVSAGLETKFAGTITKISDINRTRVEFECSDPFYLLNMKVPTRLFQSDCPWQFCDENCTLSAADYTTAFTAGTGCTKYLLNPATAFSQADGYYTQGVVTCTAGANAGLSQTVKLHANGGLSMSAPWIVTPEAGDTFSVIKGCAKTMSACSAVNNLSNYGGTPFVPVESTAV